MQVVSPNYVRMVSVHNHSEHTLKFDAHFQQGNTASFTVEPHGHQDIEFTIDHGGYQTVDPVTKISVHYDSNHLGERDFSSDAGVKILHFNVTVADGHIQWNEHNHNDQ